MPSAKLTNRESEVAALVLEGKSNRAIAQALWLSERTVENHVRSICDKLGVRTRVEIATSMLRAESASRARGRSNVPAELTPLIGRDRVFEEVRAILAAHRLVTLTGSGGVGKTRLAEAVGRAELDAQSGDVWYTELANVSEPQLVAGAVSATLNVETGNGAPVDALATFIGDRSMVLILDNCEQVIDAVAPLASQLLRACPRVRILATSMEPLAVDGEALYRVPSLDVPPETVDSVEAALAHGAVALFTSRAQAARGTFRLTASELAPVVTICRRLDGIPLAIELAAARIAFLSPRQLSERLDERFRILGGGKRGGLARHRTLRATIDWSHDLLTPVEQTLFRRLSVFRGEWTIDAAIAVCARDGLSEGAAFDAILSLAQKSLLAKSEDGFERFRFLETTQAYAAEKLLASGEADVTVARFVERMVAFATEPPDVNSVTGEADWLRRIEAELDSLNTALDWTLTGGRDVVSGAQIVIALTTFWVVRRNLEGKHWLKIALGYADRMPELLAARVVMSSLRLEPFGDRTIELAERSIATCRAGNDSAGVVTGLQILGQTLINAELHDAARAPLTEGLEIARRTASAWEAIRLEVLLAFAQAEAGGLSGAEVDARFAAAERASRAAGRKRDTAFALWGRSEVASARGDATGAALHLRAALDCASEVGDAAFGAQLRSLLAHALFDAGDLDAAELELRASIGVLEAHARSQALTDAAVVSAAIMNRKGHYENAAVLIGFISGRLERTHGLFKLTKRRSELFVQTRENVAARLPGSSAFFAKGATLDDAAIVAIATQGFAASLRNDLATETNIEAIGG